MTTANPEVAQRLANVIHASLTAAAEPYADSETVAVALSGGADSCSVLAGLMAVGAKPIIVSYTPDTHESTDFRMAAETAENLGLRFVPAYVSMHPDDLEDDARFLIARGFRSQLMVESMSPMITIQREAQKAGVTTLFTGDQSDGYFINSNWAPIQWQKRKGYEPDEYTKIHTDTTTERIDDIRREYFASDKSCSEAIKKMGLEFGLEVVVPYRDPAILEAFLGTFWAEVNKPRFKEPIRVAFAEWFRSDRILVRDKVVNLHKGDSQFAEKFRRALLGQPHLSGYRSPIGLYNAIARGEA